MLKLPELLSPAGSFESMRAAVNNGCNAIYFGVSYLSARQSAENFSEKDIEKAIDYCHLRGVNAYIALNILLKNTEIKEAVNIAKRLYLYGADGIIVQDIGIAQILNKYLQGFNIHASTQMTVHNVEGVKFLETAGFKRIILSREMSLKEINYIYNNTKIELECFVHGALCVSYSGQCLLSSLKGGRSGNRGYCAQGCRHKYSLEKLCDVNSALAGNSKNLHYNKNEYNQINSGYLLSCKDMQTIELIPDLVESGISSFKIEGRMKSPEYVACVTGIYRKYIDLYNSDPHNFKVDQNDFNDLLQVFNRGGFNKGYYHSYSGKKMITDDAKPGNMGLYIGEVIYATENKCNVKLVADVFQGDGIEIYTDSEPHPGCYITKKALAGDIIEVNAKGNILSGYHVYRTYSIELNKKLKASFNKEYRKLGIDGYYTAHINKPTHLIVKDKFGISAEQSGVLPQQASKSPLNVEKIRQQLSKCGDTSFKFDNLSIVTDDNIFINIKGLNDIRRNTLDILKEKIIKSRKRKLDIDLNVIDSLTQTNGGSIVARNYSNDNKIITVLVKTYDQLLAAYQSPYVNRIYIEYDILIKKYEKNDLDENNGNNPKFENIDVSNIIKDCINDGIEVFIALPQILRQPSHSYYENLTQYLNIVDGFLVRNYGQIDFVMNNCLLKTNPKSAVIDYSLHTFNNLTVQYWQDMGFKEIALSPELTLNEITQINNNNTEIIVYGNMKAMVTQQCPIGAHFNKAENEMYCSKRFSDEKYILKDYSGGNLFIFQNCEQCICDIYYGEPVFLLSKINEIVASHPRLLRLEFTNESYELTSDILLSYGKRINKQTSNNLIDNELFGYMKQNGYNMGHFYKDVK